LDLFKAFDRSGSNCGLGLRKHRLAIEVGVFAGNLNIDLGLLDTKVWLELLEVMGTTLEEKGVSSVLI